MSLIFFPMSISFMSHVGLKKLLCRPVDFKGQGLEWRGGDEMGGCLYVTSQGMGVGSSYMSTGTEGKGMGRGSVGGQGCTIRAYVYPGD